MGTDSQELAEDRTDWAEDRTLLANERTFGSWMRTGMSAVAIGLGIQAIFKEAEPTWLAKLGATIFIIIGVYIFVAAWKTSCAMLERLESHSAQPLPRSRLRNITGLFAGGSTLLAVILWLL